MRKYKNWNNITFLPQTNTTIIKNKNNYMLISEFNNKLKNSIYFVKTLATHKIKNINISNSCTSLKINYSNIKYKTKLAKDSIYKYLFTIHSNFFEKIKVKGKGYRIRKQKKMLKFIMYFSHINLVYIGKKHILKKIGKYKFMLISKHFEILKNDTRNIANIRHADLFTKRGLRIGRENIIKKQGKKSAYMK